MMNVDVKLSPNDIEYIEREHIDLSSFISNKIHEQRMGMKNKYMYDQIDEKLLKYEQILQKINKSLPDKRIDEVLCIYLKMEKKMFELNDKINLICSKFNIDIYENEDQKDKELNE
jgi:hypothetical protein